MITLFQNLLHGRAKNKMRPQNSNDAQPKLFVKPGPSQRARSDLWGVQRALPCCWPCTLQLAMLQCSSDHGGEQCALCEQLQSDLDHFAMHIGYLGNISCQRQTVSIILSFFGIQPSGSGLWHQLGPPALWFCPQAWVHTPWTCWSPRSWSCCPMLWGRCSASEL